MDIHSKTLVHWIGNDFENGPENIKMHQYAKRLRDFSKMVFLKRTGEAVLRRMKIANLLKREGFQLLLKPMMNFRKKARTARFLSEKEEAI